MADGHLAKFGIPTPQELGNNAKLLGMQQREHGTFRPKNIMPWDVPLEANAMMASPVPILGDLMGLAADAKMYWEDPDSRTLPNFALSAAGLLPFVPAGAAVRGIADGARGDNTATAMGTRRKSIDSFDDIIDAHRGDGGELFVRWSAGPEFDLLPNANSKDYQTGGYHEGLSATPIDSDYFGAEWRRAQLTNDQNIFRALRDYSYLRGGGYKNNLPHIYRGKKLSIDSDGAPTIRPSEYLGTISDRLIGLIDDESVLSRINAEDNIKFIESQLDALKEGKISSVNRNMSYNDLQMAIEDLEKIGGEVSSRFRRK